MSVTFNAFNTATTSPKKTKMDQMKENERSKLGNIIIKEKNTYKMQKELTDMGERKAMNDKKNH